jgi:hypothetical protein
MIELLYMKVLKIGLILVVFSLFLSGCLKKEGEDKKIGGENEKQEESITGTFKQLLGMGKSLMCSWEDLDMQGRGVTYVSGEKYRSDVEYQQGSERVTTTSISDGEWIYNFSSIMAKGTKMKLEAMEDFTDEDSGDLEDYKDREDIDQTTPDDVNFECKSWKVDNSKFNPPSDIEFEDTSQVWGEMEQKAMEMEEGIGELKDSVCQMCDLLSEQAKIDCLASCQ